ncbi:hypothetical protein GCM10022225_68730 [Plantactinospora mayteni]|uniref:Transposase n=1 Tax=Plantactinospora mayteni TaxID=566021 RepID=A0ABQ4F0W4_9ACTN|nr:hypothetical protein Pma05_71160 [Plantactinospora mayteni]
MKLRRRIRPYHRRDWRRLWRYCRCGFRWRCPDSVELVPMPYQPPPTPPLSRADYRAAVRATASVPAPPTTPRTRATNRRHGWDGPTHSHLANGRAGGLTPAQQHRSRHSAARS